MTSVRQNSKTVRFGAFELDLSAGELRKQGVRVRLQEQPFRILQLLLESPGRLVSREELRTSLWPSNSYIDFDQGLNRAINKLREALGDSAETPIFVETLAKRGYRFIGDLPARSTVGDSVVVLPFVNMSADPENEYFADGITEEIINALAQIRDLHVVARSSAFSFKGKHVDPRVAGEQLDVRTILEGSVRRAGDQLRITAQLVNAADGFHLWSERYDRELKDVFAIQDEIARSIALRLQISFAGDEAGPLVRAGTRSPEAYEAYVKGRVLLYKRGAAIPRALEACRRAVTLDPEYAQAWAGLADAHSALGYYGFVRPEVTMPKAIEAARRAVALDASLAEAHTALAMACLMGTCDKTESGREFLHALELSPRYAQARAWYALFYLQAQEGRLDEGVAQARMAEQSDPLSAYASAMYGLTCGIAGNYAEAIPACARGVSLDLDSFLAHWCQQCVLYLSGRFEEAAAEGEIALAMSGRHCWAMWTLALTCADSGKAADADALYAEMLARAHRQYLPPVPLAIAAAAAGMEDQAVRHAEEAFEIRDPHCQFFFSRYFPATARLYAYRGFREIIARMGPSAWLC
jgi:TolB-like protein/DNA-binding winged helix-turn-helix (wHTH) protein